MHQKPKAVRNQYAFLLAAGFVFVVAGIWTLTLPDRLSNITGESIVSDSADGIRIPFGGVLAELKGQWGKLSASLPMAKSEEVPISEPATTTLLEINYPDEELPAMPVSEAKEILIATTSASATTPSF